MASMISAIGGGKIVTAPSNAAVANLALKLVATKRFSFPGICIFGDGCNFEFLLVMTLSDKRSG